MPVPFADVALAERIEASVARDLTRYADACLALEPGLPVACAGFAGGVAVYIAPDSPANMLFGAGFAGPVSADEIAGLEAFYASRGTRATVSLSPLADESLHALLSARGWALIGFENVLVRGLTAARAVRRGAHAIAPPARAAGVSVREASGPHDRALWADISASAFDAPDEPSREVVRLAEAAAARADMRLLLGDVDGVAAGAGALWVDDGLGWMLGDATLPPLRRRGVQSALLAERTRLAEAAGCDLAVTEAHPGSTSQRNMERLGYSVVYTRVELIAPPPRR